MLYRKPHVIAPWSFVSKDSNNVKFPEEMGITVGAVSGLLCEAKKNGELDGDKPHPDEPAEPGALSEQD